MPRIQQLSPSVVNKIAAGEVIERPASVVKELLENSLDALAMRIEVEIAAGGSELIRVVDDGEGIHPGDVELAVTSHATSKIQDADDLFHVQTMGFRGEALASIAEVSRLRLRSRPADSTAGTEIEVRHGQVGDPQPCGCPVGTQLEIRDLFANTPVRRRFLKSPATEFGHISEQFTRVALAHPRLRMVLRHNGKAVYELPPTDRLLDRLRLFFGSELAEQLIPVEAEQAGVRLWGYVGHPSQNQAARKGQYLYLNGRWIQDRTLQHALTEAYRGLLMVGRQPVCFLFLEMPPGQVDVNVHPTKIEVRFRDSQQLYRLVLSCLRTKFLGMDLNNQLRVPAASASPAVDPLRQRQLQEEFADWAKSQLLNWQPSPVAPTSAEGFTDSLENAESGRFSATPRTAAANPRVAPSNDAQTVTAHPIAADDQEQPNPPTNGVRNFAPTTRAMQIHDCYLVVETSDGMTVIDQHALHERILYEHLRTRVLSGTVESQKLLVPQTVELSPKDAALLVENAGVLQELGFGIEDFGQGTVLVTQYPVLLGRVDLEPLVKDVAAKLDGVVASPSRRELLDSLLHMMSCKAAIKAGHRLTPEEIDSLLAQRHLVNDAHHCPHGRPTALTLSRAELDRQFGRLG